MTSFPPPRLREAWRRTYASWQTVPSNRQPRDTLSFLDRSCKVFLHSNGKVTTLLGERVGQSQRMKAQADAVHLLPEMLPATLTDNSHTLLQDALDGGTEDLAI